MKKIVFICLLAVLFFSCKDEAKSGTELKGEIHTSNQNTTPNTQQEKQQNNEQIRYYKITSAKEDPQITLENFDN